MPMRNGGALALGPLLTKGPHIRFLTSSSIAVLALSILPLSASATPVGAADSAGGQAAVGAVSSPVTELAPLSYTAIDGHTETLTPWQGKNVSVLVEPGPVRDAVVMTKMVDSLDRAWDYYFATTGQLPAVGHSLNGRDVVAEVTTTCGAGCTYIGATGTEMLTSYFESFYEQIASGNLYDHVAFYEMGRSFWRWDQLAFKAPEKDPVVTGFAVLMRFESMAAAGLAGAPFNGTPFTSFAQGVVALAGQYEADPSLTFGGTLAQDKSPGVGGGTDFWASLMMQLAQRHGGQVFLTRFFHAAHALPAASSTAQAVANWVTAANTAACSDLGPVFYTRWGFPRPDGSVSPRPTAASVPEPGGRCPSITAHPRGGSGVLSRNGRVGRFYVGKTAMAQVRRRAGRPSSTSRVPGEGGVPAYELRYRCGAGRYTSYHFDRRRRLANFSTTCQGWRTADATRIGSSYDEAVANERRTPRPAGCGDGETITRTSPRAYLFVSFQSAGGDVSALAVAGRNSVLGC